LWRRDTATGVPGDVADARSSGSDHRHRPRGEHPRVAGSSRHARGRDARGDARVDARNSGRCNSRRCHRCEAGRDDRDEEEEARQRRWLRRGLLLRQEVAISMPVHGIGLGLRWALTDDILERPPPELAWLEVAPENYMRRGGRFPAALSACAERWPIVTHGLTMSLGGIDPLDPDYLRTLASFAREIGTPWHSDHLCFGIVDGVALHDLLPLPFSQRSAEYVARRVVEAQDALGLPMAVENISYYAQPRTGASDPHGDTDMDEADFARSVVEIAGCSLLLDVNNVYVNSKNHGFDARKMIAKMPLERVVQIHVAGHDESDPELIVDTHAEPVKNDVYELLAFALEMTGPVPILLERDDNFPSWEELCRELGRLDAILRDSVGRAERTSATSTRP
jgi:uncharacterized protein